MGVGGGGGGGGGGVSDKESVGVDCDECSIYLFIWQIFVVSNMQLANYSTASYSIRLPKETHSTYKHWLIDDSNHG